MFSSSPEKQDEPDLSRGEDAPECDHAGGIRNPVEIVANTDHHKNSQPWLSTLLLIVQGPKSLAVIAVDQHARQRKCLISFASAAVCIMHSQAVFKVRIHFKIRDGPFMERRL